MPSPDDQRFDAMLRREMKSDAPAPRADCPSPEQLAALWERSLSRPERALVESHIAGCVRCQAAMAAIARADSERAPAHAPGLWIRVAAPAAVLAVVVGIIGFNLFGGPMHRRREQIAMALRHRLHRHHRKSAPVFTPAPPPSAKAGAALAARKNAPTIAEPERLARAENQLQKNPAPPPVKLAHPQLAETQPPRSETAMTERHQAPKAEPANPPEPANSIPRRIHRAEVPPPASPASAPAQAAMPQASPAVPMPAPVGMAKQGAAPAAPVQNPAAAPAVSAASTPGTSPPAESGAAQEYAARAPERQLLHKQNPPGGASNENMGMVTAPSEAGGTAGRPASIPQGLRPGFVSFQSPPPEVIAWNVGADGLIQRLGKSGWETLHSGTNADLLSGSAPSARVCWIAGKDGTLLRTIDGGDHWEPITPPAAVELVKIEASSADSATVTTADGRRFSTTDAGQDWTADTE